MEKTNFEPLQKVQTTALSRMHSRNSRPCLSLAADNIAAVTISWRAIWQLWCRQVL